MDNELKPTMKIALAINKINSNAKFDFNGDDIDTIEINWIDGTTPIAKEDIKAGTELSFDYQVLPLVSCSSL